MRYLFDRVRVDLVHALPGQRINVGNTTDLGLEVTVARAVNVWIAVAIGVLYARGKRQDVLVEPAWHR
jgi:hypothetical protein